MPVFNTIEGLERPTEEMRGDVIVKKVAEKDISRETDGDSRHKFVPVFMDDTNR